MTDFRSYASFSVQLDGRPVAIAGENGAGKTNILEALSLLGPGRGLRGARLSELARLQGPGSWAVAIRVDDGEDNRALGVGTDSHSPDRRVCRLDGRSVSGPSAFLDLVRFLWLTPAQDRLFVEGASDRRRFFDRIVLTHQPTLSRVSTAYEQAMRQRQKLLEMRSRDNGWLTALEQQMAEAGVAIADARRETAKLLMAHDVAGTEGVFPAADIALEGDVEASLSTAASADVEDMVVERLKYQRAHDQEAGRALFGPHRSDLIVGHRPKGQPARLCSTGEQKALLIGMVLANGRALSSAPASAGNKGAGRTAPLVLLLDEIAAHLDPDRRACLFNILDGLGFPVFMTGTDHDLFAAWGARAQHLTIREGKAIEAIAA